MIYPVNLKRTDSKKALTEQSVTFEQMISEKNLCEVLERRVVSEVRPGLELIRSWRNKTLHEVRTRVMETNAKWKVVGHVVTTINRTLLEGRSRSIRKEMLRILMPWQKERYPDGKFLRAMISQSQLKTERRKQKAFAQAAGFTPEAIKQIFDKVAKRDALRFGL